VVNHLSLAALAEDLLVPKARSPTENIWVSKKVQETFNLARKILFYGRNGEFGVTTANEPSEM